MKKRILAYNQMLMKENQEKLTAPSSVGLQRPILPPVDVSPRRKLNIENSPETISLAAKTPNITPPKKYSYLKELESPLEPKTGGLTRSPRLDKSPVLSPITHTQSDPSERWNGALALMQLASSPPSRKFSQQST